MWMILGKHQYVRGMNPGSRSGTYIIRPTMLLRAEVEVTSGGDFLIPFIARIVNVFHDVGAYCR